MAAGSRANELAAILLKQKRGRNMLTKAVAVKQGFTNKKCPKCGGNTFLDMDIYGWHEQCLQCGRSSDLPEIGEYLR